MIGGFGCPCSKCQGTGTIHMQIRSKLCAIERLLGVEIVVTKGYRCEDSWKRNGNDPKEWGHSAKDENEGCALAVDFFPRNSTYNMDRVPSGDGKKWGTRRFDFVELVRPYFSQVRIVTDPEDHNKWSIHGEIDRANEL